MAKAKDISGRRFGRLVAIEIDEASRGGVQGVSWKCICDCGNSYTVRASNLNDGSTRSCGCLMKDFWALSPEEKKAAKVTVWE